MYRLIKNASRVAILPYARVISSLQFVITFVITITRKTMVLLIVQIK